MGHTLKNAFSHLPSISEENFKTPISSLSFFRGKSKIISHTKPRIPPSLVWARFGQDLGGPQHSLGMVEQQEKQQEYLTFSLGLDVYATVRKGLLHVSPHEIHPLKNVFHVPPQSPFSLASFLKKYQIGMTAACRPLATLFDQKAQTREKIPVPLPHIFQRERVKLETTLCCY